MADINKAVDSGISKVIEDFREHPQYYFTEEDLRWRLIKEIENALTVQAAQYVRFLGGGVTPAVRAEYPTPFRCSMREHSFRLDLPDSRGKRGHFDIAVLNASAAAKCDFEALRFQDYKVVRKKLLGQEMQEKLLPFLDAVIEIKLFRDLIHPNRTRSVQQQVEYAVQAIKKVAAALEAPRYYHKPFANRGLVLLFDNSDLVAPGNAELAQNRFLDTFRESTNWGLLPDTLSCIWVTPQKWEDWHGERPLTWEW